MDPDRPAPGSLELVRRLLNSVDRIHGVDHACDLRTLNTYLSETGMGPPMRDEDDLAAFTSWRDAVRAWLLEPGGAEAVALDELARGLPVLVRFTSDGVTAVRPSAGAHATPVEVLGATIVTAIHDAEQQGTWSHLRVCQRDDCQWVYYAATRAGTSRWCSTDPCGNVMKMRAYRSRRAVGA